MGPKRFHPSDIQSPNWRIWFESSKAGLGVDKKSFTNQIQCKIGRIQIHVNEELHDQKMRKKDDE